MEIIRYPYGNVVDQWPAASVGGGASAVANWILASGFWDDSKLWDDTKTWID